MSGASGHRPFHCLSSCLAVLSLVDKQNKEGTAGEVRNDPGLLFCSCLHILRFDLRMKGVFHFSRSSSPWRLATCDNGTAAPRCSPDQTPMGNPKGEPSRIRRFIGPPAQSWWRWPVSSYPGAPEPMGRSCDNKECPSQAARCRRVIHSTRESPFGV